jgi:D-alanyl-D-alanine carboxypeptidase (penicillin-binding protein 5/6)
MAKVRQAGLVLLALLAAAVPGAVPADSPPFSPAPPREVEAIPVALLHDLGSGRALLAHNADLRFVPASMAKVMTAYVAFELIARGQLSPDQKFRVAAGMSARFDASGSSMDLKDGEEVSVDRLLQGLLTVSANDAAEVIAEGYSGSVPAWCALMNAEARRLGLKDSHFATPNGWPDGGKTYVSARDLVRLGEALIYRHPALYRRYFGQMSLELARGEGRNFDPVTGVVAGADGMKTGHTAEAGYNFLGSAERDGRRLMMVVAGATSIEERAAASRTLLEWGFAQWSAQLLFAAGAKVADAQVQNGAARRVALVAPYAIHAVQPRGVEKGKSPALRLIYQGPLVAPIVKGQKFAELEISMPDQTSSRVPLYAAENIALAGPLDRLGNGLAGLLP